MRAAVSALCKVFAAERLLYNGLNGPIDELRILVSRSQHLASTYTRLLHYQEILLKQCALPCIGACRRSDLGETFPDKSGYGW